MSPPPAPGAAPPGPRWTAQVAPVRPLAEPPGTARHSGSAPVPTQWSTPAPELDLPDRSRRGRRPTSGKRPASPWLTVVGVLAVAVLAGVFAAGGYIMFNHAGAQGDAGASPVSRPTPHDITSRTVDPAPLSAAEVFPAPVVNPGGYQVLKTQAADCPPVALGDPLKVLATAECTQSVRATVVSADQAFVATAGLLNLGTQDEAQRANDELSAAVGAQKGRFVGMDGGGPSVVFAKATTQLGWDVRGHFLGFCVVAKVGGGPVDAADPAVKKIIDDLVEKYLIGTVVQARVTPPGPTPGPSPTKAGGASSHR